LISEYELQKLIQFIEDDTGIDFSKADKFQIDKRLKSLDIILTKRSVNFSSLFSEDFKQFLGDSNLKKEIVNIFTNNETAFFRDRRPFDLLTHLSEVGGLPNYHISVLSLPCSTGQEPYSILFTLLKTGYDSKCIRLVAADLDSEVLDKAKNGVYNKFELMRGLSEDNIENYFDKKGEVALVKNDFRRIVEFKEFNLMKDQFEPDEFDVIFLRNVLFYFNDENKNIALERISRSLKPGGIILLGNGERVPCETLEERNFEGMIYYIKI
jgi:chemotaxis protein methyltransferase CheR